MTPSTQTQFTNEFFQLLKETFEGPEPTGPSAFLDKGTGLFQTLDGISAEIASAHVRAEGSTIAAHTEHIRFYVDVHYKLLRGVRDKIDWDESWRIKSVKAAQWDALREDLRRVYATVKEHLRRVNGWGEDEISIAMAIVAHTAYHLGAIRQILLTVQPS
jgi:ATP-dependent phosphoenolpyruvate carboxykinase